jgi:hypothetical protein
MRAWLVRRGRPGWLLAGATAGVIACAPLPPEGPSVPTVETPRASASVKPPPAAEPAAAPVIEPSLALAGARTCTLGAPTRLARHDRIGSTLPFLAIGYDQRGGLLAYHANERRAVAQPVDALGRAAGAPHSIETTESFRPIRVVPISRGFLLVGNGWSAPPQREFVVVTDRQGAPKSAVIELPIEDRAVVNVSAGVADRVLIVAASPHSAETSTRVLLVRVDENFRPTFEPHDFELSTTSRARVSSALSDKTWAVTVDGAGFSVQPPRLLLAKGQHDLPRELVPDRLAWHDDQLHLLARQRGSPALHVDTYGVESRVVHVRYAHMTANGQLSMSQVHVLTDAHEPLAPPFHHRVDLSAGPDRIERSTAPGALPVGDPTKTEQLVPRIEAAALTDHAWTGERFVVAYGVDAGAQGDTQEVHTVTLDCRTER